MIVPLGKQAYRRIVASLPEVQLVNFYMEKDESGLSPDGTVRMPRPGLLAPPIPYPAPVRGLDFRVNPAQNIAIAGTTLYANGVAAAGTISGTDLVATVDTTFGVFIVADGKLYHFDTAVTEIVIPDGRIVIDVDQINQYVIVGCLDGRFYWIVPGETTIDPLNFATAESSNDELRAVCRVSDEIYLFSATTIEVWQATGDQDAPFQRTGGVQYDRGCISGRTVARFDNSVMWVSDDRQVCRLGNVAQVVSDPSLAERIRQAEGVLSAWTFIMDGHEFYILNIPGVGSYAYDALSQSWSRFQTEGLATWLPIMGYQTNGAVICGGDNDGRVFQVATSFEDDDGLPIKRIVTGTVPIIGKSGRNDNVSIGVGSRDDATINVRWRDGQDGYGPAETLEVRAPYDVANLYRLGMPEQPFREIEISTTARVSIFGCVANEAWK